MQKYKQNDLTFCNYATFPHLKHIPSKEWVKNHLHDKLEVAFLPFKRTH